MTRKYGAEKLSRLNRALIQVLQDEIGAISGVQSDGDWGGFSVDIGNEDEELELNNIEPVEDERIDPSNNAWMELQRERRKAAMSVDAFEEPEAQVVENDDKATEVLDEGALDGFAEEFDDLESIVEDEFEELGDEEPSVAEELGELDVDDEEQDGFEELDELDTEEQDGFELDDTEQDLIEELDELATEEQDIVEEWDDVSPSDNGIEDWIDEF